MPRHLLLLALLCHAGFGLCTAEDAVPTPAVAPVATVPAPRDTKWQAKHTTMMQALVAQQPKLLMLGDSITEGWLWKDAKAVWEAQMLPRGAGNAGIAGDRTQHVLWRIQQGLLDKISPQVVVLLIGTNNLKQGDHQDTAADTAAGVAAIVTELKTRLPRATIVLMAILPRQSSRYTWMAATIADCNARVQALADGQRVRWLDISAAFVEPDGSLGAAFDEDQLHLSVEGYQRWAKAIAPTLDGLMGTAPVAAPAGAATGP